MFVQTTQRAGPAIARISRIPVRKSGDAAGVVVRAEADDDDLLEVRLLGPEERDSFRDVAASRVRLAQRPVRQERGEVRRGALGERVAVDVDAPRERRAAAGRRHAEDEHQLRSERAP